MSITLTDDGLFLLGEAKVKLAQLPAKLKARGATPATLIRVRVPLDVPEATLKAISGKMVSEGLWKVMFVKPKQAVSFVDPRAGKKP